MAEQDAPYVPKPPAEGKSIAKVPRPKGKWKAKASGVNRLPHDSVDTLHPLVSMENEGILTGSDIRGPTPGVQGASESLGVFPHLWQI